MTFSGWRERLREWARTIKREVTVLWIAARDPHTPIIAKVVAAMVAAYALSPIDLIPDFIPGLGYLDDVIIVPLGIMLALKLIPNHLTAEFRARAQLLEGRPTAALVSPSFYPFGFWHVPLSSGGGGLTFRLESSPPRRSAEIFSAAFRIHSTVCHPCEHERSQGWQLRYIFFSSEYAPSTLSLMVTGCVPRLRQNQPWLPSKPAVSVPLCLATPRSVL